MFGITNIQFYQFTKIFQKNMFNVFFEIIYFSVLLSAQFAVQISIFLELFTNMTLLWKSVSALHLPFLFT